jgi:hypothetical protein
LQLLHEKRTGNSAKSETLMNFKARLKIIKLCSKAVARVVHESRKEATDTHI